jgi:hypothetical protein
MTGGATQGQKGPFVPWRKEILRTMPQTIVPLLFLGKTMDFAKFLTICGLF